MYIEELKNLKYLEDSSKPEVISTEIFIKKLNDFENNRKKDGLSMTRFRIVNRETFKDK